MSKYVYVLMRIEDGDGYDFDYPIEAVFRRMEDAQQYRNDLFHHMKVEGDIDTDADIDEVLEIISRPLVNAFGEEDEA